MKAGTMQNFTSVLVPAFLKILSLNTVSKPFQKQLRSMHIFHNSDLERFSLKTLRKSRKCGFSVLMNQIRSANLLSNNSLTYPDMFIGYSVLSIQITTTN